MKGARKRVRHHYPLSLTLLLEVLQAMSGTHVLSAELPPQRGISREVCVAIVTLRDGKLIECQIKNSKGAPLLQQEAAFQTLAALGEVNWSLLSSSIVPSSLPKSRRLPDNRSSARQEKRIPVRHLSGVIPPSLSHREKQVLSLIDGKRDVQQIADLLHLSLDHIQTILLRLEHTYFISFQERNEKP